MVAINAKSAWKFSKLLNYAEKLWQHLKFIMEWFKLVLIHMDSVLPLNATPIKKSVHAGRVESERVDQTSKPRSTAIPVPSSASRQTPVDSQTSALTIRPILLNLLS